jgi:glycine/D-amino acid oxidase-like deaminating enzyme
MKVLIAYPCYIESDYKIQFIYQPELASYGDYELKKSIMENMPNVIVVGNNIISKETLELFNQVKVPVSYKGIIRRGSSLARIDCKTAENFGMEILNTPGINSPFVANYILDQLKLKLIPPSSSVKIAIIGSGNIGSFLLKNLSSLQHRVFLYSPSLVSLYTKSKILKEKGLEGYNFEISSDSISCIEEADYVIIAVDVSAYREEDKFDIRFVNKLKTGVKFMSVSENKIFEHSALKRLIERCAAKEMELYFDGVPSEIKEIISIAGAGILDNLHTSSKAMTSNECQISMDTAVKTVIETLYIKNFLLTDYEIAQKSGKRINIIGAGINGLINALFLNKKGYKVKIIESRDNSLETAPLTKGTTWGGLDIRHGSYTETTPHASFARRDCLKNTVEKGGWLLKQDFNKEEIPWINSFENLTAFPAMHSLYADHAISLNKYGYNLWLKIFEEYPALIKDTLWNNKVIRVYTSVENLEEGYRFQSKIHERELRLIKSGELSNLFPALDINNIVGGVEVDCFVINIQTLLKRLIVILEKSGVEFNWNTDVNSLLLHQDANSVSLYTNLHSDNFVQPEVSHVINNVVGVMIEIPNIQNITQGLKIHASEPVGIMNISPSSDKKNILITGGFGYIGKSGLNDYDFSVEPLLLKMKEAVHKFLPVYYEIMMKDFKYKCVARPMTYNGIPFVKK